MTLIAAGAYLRCLRKHHCLSQPDIAARIAVSLVQVRRIESGQVDSSGSSLGRFVRAVQGNAEQFAALLLDDQASADDGRRAARDWVRSTVCISEILDDPEALRVMQQTSALMMTAHTSLTLLYQTLATWYRTLAAGASQPAQHLHESPPPESPSDLP